MKTLRLQLPDGRAVTVSGDTTEEISTFVANQYFGQSLPVKNSDAVYKTVEYTPVVEALPTPVMHFEPKPDYSGQAQVPAAPAQAVESLLLVPGLSFEIQTCESGSGTPGGQPAPASFPRYTPLERPVLNLPTMNFEKPKSKSKRPQ